MGGTNRQRDPSLSSGQRSLFRRLDTLAFAQPAAFRFGFFLKERMDKPGIECQVRLREEYGGDHTPQMFRDMVAFFQKYFPQ